jgi:hypothetical protein
MYVFGVPIVPLFSLDFSIEFWNFSESEVFSFYFNAYILYVYINIYILKVALSTIKQTYICQIIILSIYVPSTHAFKSTCLMSISRFFLRDKVWLRLLKLYFIADMAEWYRALDIRLSDWCCSASMVWVQIPIKTIPPW